MQFRCYTKNTDDWDPARSGPDADAAISLWLSEIVPSLVFFVSEGTRLLGKSLTVMVQPEPIVLHRTTRYRDLCSRADPCFVVPGRTPSAECLQNYTLDSQGEFTPSLLTEWFLLSPGAASLMTPSLAALRAATIVGHDADTVLCVS